MPTDSSGFNTDEQLRKLDKRLQTLEGQAQPKGMRVYFPTSWPWPVTALSLVATVHGLLSLAEQLTPIALYGLLATTVDVYRSFVDATIGGIFGWIDFGWFSMSEAERHTLVIASIVLGAAVRATSKACAAEGNSWPWWRASGLVLGASGVVALLFIALPTKWSLILVGTALAFLFVPKQVMTFAEGAIAYEGMKYGHGDDVAWTTTEAEREEAAQSARAARREILWSIGGFVAVMILNYALLQFIA